jgi:hypothetical protein
MPSVIELLDRFNRKERYFLVGLALGNPGFRPHAQFLQRLANEVGVTFPHDPDDTRCFMDYHLDWLYASLVLADPDSVMKPHHDTPKFPTLEPDVFSNVNTNQEDVDLLLAFENGATTHVVMVEAKGETGWSSSQILSKARRLKHIFGDEAQGHLGLGMKSSVEPHFAVASRDRPTGLEKKLNEQADGIPDWMWRDGKLPWIELTIPNDRLRLEQCDGQEPSNAKKSDLYWRVNPPLTVDG